MDKHQLAMIVVEDDSAARATIALLLRAERMRVARVAGNVRIARAVLERHRYGVAVLDVHLGADSGLGLAERRRTSSPDIPVALFTGYCDAAVILNEALRLGARGFVTTCSEAPIPARQQAAERRSFELEVDPVPSRQAIVPERTRLDSEEHAVLSLLATGLTRSVIAERLVLAPEAVHDHIGNASAKLGTSTRVMAVAALVRSCGVGKPTSFVTA
jgi:DNA-binding NarL/FixJ family response regulator